ncbi:hypothetical protein P8C59_007942 [Phyllachora maydis]|uniref:Uncharacterized protein n=1 Tax=Phyllachora maydis TaxID=1825666 RepID=A0AAD9I9G8_9PEZI|nr:hypothetical protein P8C59_007942 [Phyllachora maydis]
MAHMLTAQRGRAKSDKVSDLLAKLTDDLRSLNLSQQQRDAALEELKVLGRDPKNADPIFTTEGIHTLTRHAFNAYDNANSSDGRNPVNPITGQFLESENQPELPEMTGEEKEREAERLFVLFERLKRNGLIQVQNPVAQAVEECRFEELGDDGDEATLIESFNDKQSDISGQYVSADQVPVPSEVP